MDFNEHLQAAATLFGSEPFLVLPNGQEINLEQGYIPLLANFTFEDKAAKGLRKHKAEEKPQPPVHFSALELVQAHKFLLLTGPSGSGKTSFAKHLAFRLATTGRVEAQPLVRNENGDFHEEFWNAEGILPCYFAVEDCYNARTLMNSIIPKHVGSVLEKQGKKPGLLVIVDAIDKARDDGPDLLLELLSFINMNENIKLLLLGETSAVKQWAIPPEVTCHSILPLLEIQRRQAIGALTSVASHEIVVGVGPAAATPVNFALALQAEHIGDRPEELLDAWLAYIAPKKDDSDRIVNGAFYYINGTCTLRHDIEVQWDMSRPATPKSRTLLSCNAVRQLLAARCLIDLPIKTAITLFENHPLESEPVLYSLLARLTNDKNDKLVSLAEGLIRGSGISAQLGALLVSDFITELSGLEDQISSHMQTIIGEGLLSVMQRARAGRILSRLGDPRDLTALTAIPAGQFTFGSESHPNSRPAGKLWLEGFRIGLYPVINRDFSIFAREIGLNWQSPNGFYPEKQNEPATDLTWFNANAYCVWLTRRWRLDGKIAPDEHVRLPTEPEWERASRGDQNFTDNGRSIYPWGMEWQENAANCEETGFNETCCVGLFPTGRSPYGCYDMVGQVWEWCTTLWGEDMTTPLFKYPWSNDGREELGAPISIRRVLRGGCFSSGRLKACCTYRGSLEPSGFWRGNGFRIVVAPVP